MIATAESTLRLIKLDISNFMRVQALSIDADGHHVVISGPNASGKTSAVEAIWTALKGANAKDIPEPIRAGAAKASVVLDLGEYRVERRWSEKSTSLIVTAADGSRIAKPQQLLDGLLGKYSLDPVAFLDRRPIDQVDDVLSLAGVSPPVAKVTEILGEVHPVRSGESADGYLMRLSADDTGVVYLRRREANRTLEQKRAAIEEQRRVVSQLGSEAPGQAQSASAIVGQIERLQVQADARRMCRVLDLRSEAR